MSFSCCRRSGLREAANVPLLPDDRPRDDSRIDVPYLLRDERLRRLLDSGGRVTRREPLPSLLLSWAVRGAFLFVIHFPR